MPQIKIDVDLSDVVDELFDEQKVRSAATEAIRSTVRSISDTSAALAPYRTGYLRDGHSYDVTDSGAQITGIVSNHAPYWIHVNYGTSRMAPRHFLDNAVKHVNPVANFRKEFNSRYGR